MKNTDEMEVTTIHESGMSVPMYKAVSVVIEHPSGLTLTITETEEGLKVTETGRNDAGLSVRPSSGNSLYIEPCKR